MKIIFLDIDGVLNSTSQQTPAIGNEFLPRCVTELNRIIALTDAKIVLSSNWRYLIHNGYMDLTGFSILLRSHNVRGELVGFTRESEGDEPRWSQIRDWFRANSPVGTDYNYCILDDDPGAFGGRPGVQTNGNGLTEADADLAIEILNA